MDLVSNITETDAAVFPGFVYYNKTCDFHSIRGARFQTKFLNFWWLNGDFCRLSGSFDGDGDGNVNNKKNFLKFCRKTQISACNGRKVIRNEIISDQ